MERETGIEPATNSLEGCDSTTELLPPTFAHLSPLRRAGPRLSSFAQPLPNRSTSFTALLTNAKSLEAITETVAARLRGDEKIEEGRPDPTNLFARLARVQPFRTSEPRGKVGGEGRVRTSVATWAADLQSAAIDRSATSPLVCCFRNQPSGIRAGEA